MLIRLSCFIAGASTLKPTNVTPACASWFDWESVHDIEKQACPKIFARISEAADPTGEEQARIPRAHTFTCQIGDRLCSPHTSV